MKVLLLFFLSINSPRSLLPLSTTDQSVITPRGCMLLQDLNGMGWVKGYIKRIDCLAGGSNEGTRGHISNKKG